MAVSSGFKVEGLRKLNTQLRRVSKDFPKEMVAIHKQVAALVATTAKALAPKRTGRLSNSVRTNASQRSAAVVAGRSGVPYAAVIHWGWPRRNIRAQPFMADAVNMKEAAAVDLYGKLTNNFIEKVWRA